MTSQARNLKAFRDGMHALGRDEGRNIRFEYRFADGYLDRLPGLAAELIFLKPSVIVSSPLPANLAARRTTNTIPIVMATGADPVGFSLVASLSHPGGNVTGLANFAGCWHRSSLISCANCYRDSPGSPCSSIPPIHFMSLS